MTAGGVNRQVKRGDGRKRQELRSRVISRTDSGSSRGRREKERGLPQRLDDQRGFIPQFSLLAKTLKPGIVRPEVEQVVSHIRIAVQFHACSLYIRLQNVHILTL